MKIRNVVYSKKEGLQSIITKNAVVIGFILVSFENSFFEKGFLNFFFNYLCLYAVISFFQIFCRILNVITGMVIASFLFVGIFITLTYIYYIPERISLGLFAAVTAVCDIPSYIAIFRKKPIERYDCYEYTPKTKYDKIKHKSDYYEYRYTSPKKAEFSETKPLAIPEPTVENPICETHFSPDSYPPQEEFSLEFYPE